MNKSAREFIRIAEREGIKKPRIEHNGSPHARLIGEVDGQQIVLVVSLTKGVRSSPHFQTTAQTNMRRAIRAIRQKGQKQ